MATAPVPGAETRQFQRLDRVRAHRRARRHRRVILVVTLLIALAGVGVLGFTTMRRTSLERPGSVRDPVAVGMPRPAAASPAATRSTPGPPAPLVPPPTRGDAVKRNVTRPPRIRADADRRAPDAHAVDPTAAIDWLLKDRREESLR